MGCLVAGGLAVAADEPRPDYDLEIDRPAGLAVLDTAATVTVEIEIANRGSRPWSAAEGFALAYHWFDVDGSSAVWDGVRTPLSTPIGPGEEHIVDATLRAPERGGRFLLQWDVVQEGVRWLSEVDPTPVPPQPVTVRASHAFSLIRARTPRVVVAGRERSARVVVRNDGRRTWPGDGSVAMAGHWRSEAGEIVVWEGRRSAVRGEVAPGDLVVLDASVRAPAGAGIYRFEWDMVDDGTAWFSERDPSPEQGIVVVVMPVIPIGAGAWFVLVAVAATFAVRRTGSGSGWRSVADLCWAVPAVVVRQWSVVDAVGLSPSFSGAALTVAGSAVLGLLFAAAPRSVRPWLAWLTVAAVTGLLYGDILYQRFFGDLLSVSAVVSVGQLPRVGASVWSLVEAGDLWLAADLAPALVLAWVASRSTGDRTVKRRAVGALVGTAATAGFVGAVALTGQTTALRQVFHATEQAGRLGVLNFHLADAVGSAVRTVATPRLDAPRLAEITEYFDRRRSLRAATGELAGAAAGFNLVMIQVESLQSFVVGLEIGGREVTPFLNSLAADGLWFANVTDQTEEGRSSDAELATQASLLPRDRGAAAFLHGGNDFTGIASILAERGWETVSAVPFDGSFWNRRMTHRSFGFESRLFAEAFPAGETIGWGLNDRDFLAAAADRLIRLPEPWCGYLLTLSLHHPFEGFPTRHRQLDVGRWHETPFGNFLHTMRYFDGALEGFVDALEQAGVLERTVIAIWGDHDAGFEWRPEIARVMGVPADAAGWYLSQQVPLIIRVPGAPEPAGPRQLPAGHVDVAPTLLALLGVDPAPFALVGRNLLGAPGSGPVVGEYRCWRDEHHLYLRRGPLLDEGECLDVITLEPVDVEACHAAFDDARRQVEMSRMVLEHDLQRRIGDRLQGAP